MNGIESLEEFEVLPYVRRKERGRGGGRFYATAPAVVPFAKCRIERMMEKESLKWTSLWVWLEGGQDRPSAQPRISVIVKCCGKQQQK